MRKILLPILMVCGVAGAYYAGGQGAKPAPVPAPGVAAVTVPEHLGPVKPVENLALANPTEVLLGEVKVPNDLLRSPEPPARPDLIVPDLSKK